MILMTHNRHGDNGNYLYFATTGLKLNYQDENIDVENLGNSTLVTFMVITLVLLVGYIIDGVEVIQDSILEVNNMNSWHLDQLLSQPIWTLLGCLMFLASGIMVILTWSTEDYVSTSSSATELEYTRNSRAAMGLGALCIITSLIFLTDFIWVGILKFCWFFFSSYLWRAQLNGGQFLLHIVDWDPSLMLVFFR